MHSVITELFLSITFYFRTFYAKEIIWQNMNIKRLIALAAKVSATYLQARQVMTWQEVYIYSLLILTSNKGYTTQMALRKRQEPTEIQHSSIDGAQD